MSVICTLAYSSQVYLRATQNAVSNLYTFFTLAKFAYQLYEQTK